MIYFGSPQTNSEPQWNTNVGFMAGYIEGDVNAPNIAENVRLFRRAADQQGYKDNYVSSEEANNYVAKIETQFWADHFTTREAHWLSNAKKRNEISDMYKKGDQILYGAEAYNALAAAGASQDVLNKFWNLCKKSGLIDSYNGQDAWIGIGVNAPDSGHTIGAP